MTLMHWIKALGHNGHLVGQHYKDAMSVHSHQSVPVLRCCQDVKHQQKPLTRMTLKRWIKAFLPGGRRQLRILSYSAVTTWDLLHGFGYRCLGWEELRGSAGRDSAANYGAWTNINKMQRPLSFTHSYQYLKMGKCNSFRWMATYWVNTRTNEYIYFFIYRTNHWSRHISLVA